METAACVLVADDVEANVELLTDQLAPLGLRILRASDAPSAPSISVPSTVAAIDIISREATASSARSAWSA